jgi:hypothetical protein
MKKFFILTIALISIAGGVQAQYKQEKGSFLPELQFSLFNVNTKIDVDGEILDYSTGPFSMPGFRFRYFFTDRLALRTTINIDFDHDKVKRNIDETNEHYGGKEVITGEYTKKDKSTEFSIAPGLEYHFGNWERMSVYLGGELFFGIRTTKNTIDLETEALYYSRDYNSGEYIFSGIRKQTSSFEAKNCTSNWTDHYVQNGKMVFGVSALAGMDFYIYKGLYMGAELGLGYTYSTFLKGNVKENDEIIQTPVQGAIIIDKYNEEIKLEDKISNGNFSFKCNPMIRFGWKF